jgi:ATP-dependent DNA helicase RecG
LRDFQSLNPKTGKFDIVTEYHEFAWQEGIVNAVTHRDYSIKGEHIKVIMYDDRLEILSPGKLPNIVNIKNLKYTRYSRNPKRARVLSEFGWVKELNEGVKRIYKEMSDYFLDEPKFSEPNMNSLRLTLKNNIVMRKIRNMEQMSAQFTPELWDTLSSDEITAIELAYKHNKVTTKMLEEEIDRGTKFARKVLNDLVEKEILDWNGTPKTDPKQYYSFK